MWSSSDIWKEILQIQTIQTTYHFTFWGLLWAALKALGKETEWLWTAAAHFLDCDTGTLNSYGWTVAREVVERTAVLTRYCCGSPAVMVTLCLQSPPCCQGWVVTWQGGADALPSPQHLFWAGTSESLQKAPGFSTHSRGSVSVSYHRADVMMLGEAGGSSQESCTQILPQSSVVT